MAKSIRASSRKKNRDVRTKKFAPKALARLHKLADIGKQIADGVEAHSVIVHDGAELVKQSQAAAAAAAAADAADVDMGAAEQDDAGEGADAAVSAVPEGPLNQTQLNKLLKSHKMKRINKKKNSRNKQSWW